VPRLKPQEVSAATKRPRSPAQFANDERLRSKKAAPHVHVKQNMLGPDDVKHVPVNDIDISTTGDAEATHAPIEVIDPLKFESKAKNEAFMNELVEIQIEADDDPNAPLFVHSGHNGIPQYIKRGTPQTIKRKFLYSLIAGKQARLVCSFGKTSEGQEFNRLTGPSRTTHRVIVLQDTAKGRAAYQSWMQQV